MKVSVAVDLDSHRSALVELVREKCGKHIAKYVVIEMLGCDHDTAFRVVETIQTQFNIRPDNEFPEEPALDHSHRGEVTDMDNPLNQKP